jgi:hypothetical protein
MPGGIQPIFRNCRQNRSVITRRRWLAPGLVAASLLFLLAACGSSTGSTPTTDQSGTQAGTAANDAGAGGEVSIAYQDPQHRYKISAPGRMTANADGSATYLGPVDRMEITIVDGARAADPMALAQSDFASLKSSAPGFQTVSAPASGTISGHRAIKFVYQWTAGTNPVTGKVNQLITARYYITKDSGRLAIVAYGVASNQYDPHGADDVANTFAWQ